MTCNFVLRLYLFVLICCIKNCIRIARRAYLYYVLYLNLPDKAKRNQLPQIFGVGGRGQRVGEAGLNRIFLIKTALS